MDTTAALAALGALAQDHRLAVFRLLVQKGPEGLPAGAIADATAMPASSLSFHLAHLQRAGLIVQRRVGRSLVYSADFAAMSAVVGYLTENCCASATCVPAACVPAACAPASPIQTRRKSA
ncbi:MAG: helix-turn-helix transcriptional regulator [Alphaproteobacteria bacterium]|nr:helix-turn-helix transcriptional regulator [Alphaproteobacteria bacterium]